jgi:hypothetical protein
VLLLQWWAACRLGELHAVVVYNDVLGVQRLVHDDSLLADLRIKKDRNKKAMLNPATEINR